MSPTDLLADDFATKAQHMLKMAADGGVSRSRDDLLLRARFYRYFARRLRDAERRQARASRTTAGSDGGPAKR